MAFLDTLSVVNSDGTIRTRIFRKETHTDQYLNFGSNHPLEHKRGVLRTLTHRAESVVSDPQERSKELEHISNVLSVNGYPEWLLVEGKTEKKERSEEGQGKTSSSDKRRKRPIVIPYVKGASEQMRRVLGGYGIPTYFKPTNTLRQLLVRPKDRLDQEKIVGPIYRITCDDCEATYVGETERSLKARFDEHKRPSSISSEVSRHLHASNPAHTIQLDKTKVLDTEPRWFERGVKEAIYIRTNTPSLNRDGGRHNLPPVWDNILRRRIRRTGTATTGGDQSSDVPVPFAPPEGATEEGRSSFRKF